MKRLPSSTDAVHAGASDTHPGRALTLPIAQTATFTFDDTAELQRYFAGGDPDSERQEYARYGNPTVRELERRVAALDGAEDAAAFASGMAGLTTTLLALLRAGDHVVLFGDVYRRTRGFVGTVLGRFGVTHTIVEAASIDAMKAAFVPRTRIALTESPTNPYLRCVDLEAFAATCRAARVKSLVDATFATPINSRPLEFGVDLVMHSATKYLAGHNDVLAGTVSGSGTLVSLVRDLRGVLGGVLDPHAAFLVARGLKTLALRVAQQNATALAVARMLEEHAAVERVYYPGLPSHPDHEVALRQMRGFGGVVSFVVKGGREAAGRVVDRFRLATIAPSLGGAESLVEQPAIMSFSELSNEELDAIGIAPGLVRLSVGIEDEANVVGDAKNALDAS